MVKLMLDVETLSTSRNAIVTDICFLPFTSDGEIYHGIDPIRAVLPAKPQDEMLGRDMSLDTMMWWMDQSAEARAPWLRETMRGTAVDLTSMLHIITNKIRFIDPDEIWAKGPQFDVVLMEGLFQACGIEIPWEYKIVRDLRTLMAVASVKDKDVKPQVDYVKHSALSDCVFQVLCYKESIRQWDGES